MRKKESNPRGAPVLLVPRSTVEGTDGGDFQIVWFWLRFFQVRVRHFGLEISKPRQLPNTYQDSDGGREWRERKSDRLWGLRFKPSLPAFVRCYVTPQFDWIITSSKDRQVLNLLLVVIFIG